MFRKCGHNFNPYFNNRKDIFWSSIIEILIYTCSLLLQTVYCPIRMHMRVFLLNGTCNMIQKFAYMYLLKVLCIFKKKWSANYLVQFICRYSRCFNYLLLILDFIFHLFGLKNLCHTKAFNKYRTMWYKPELLINIFRK